MTVNRFCNLTPHPVLPGFFLLVLFLDIIQMDEFQATDIQGYY